MNPTRQLARVPDKPVMIFDGDCGFCRLWIRRWQQLTGDAVRYLPLQGAEVATEFPELHREELEEAVHFVAADGLVYRAAEAVFRSLAVNPAKAWLSRSYRTIPLFAPAAEAGYRFIARHRSAFSWLTRVLWGSHVESSSNHLLRFLFLRGLGLIYLVAFVSLWIQVPGLIGERGVLPAADLMTRAHAAVEANAIGADRFRLLPTLCWFGTSDGFLQFQCAAGTALAIALILGLAPTLCLAGMWLLYLSLATVGQDFLGFQWDNLLLEAGLLAIFFAPRQILPRPGREKPPPRTALWLLRLLLFKLMFLSGVVKLASGDPTWHNLSALTRHYETQPLPTPIAWYAHQLPLWFQQTSCLLMFAIELGAPFLIFTPRRPRMAGAFVLIALQVMILLTGNYTFFNWLTLLLCLLLFDDFALGKLLPRQLATLYAPVLVPATAAPTHRARWRILPTVGLALIICSVSFIQIVSSFGSLPAWTSPVIGMYRWLAPLRSINSYGLFAVMTTERPEIIVEGSADGREWQEYAFRYKPGDVARRPVFAAPHQPRLDWQMWFAALGNARQNPWFVNFCVRLLQGSPEVLALLEQNPFPGSPPKYIRARLYDYHFTTPAERRQTGNWWKRELKGEYLPPISLDMLQRPPARALP